MVSTFATSAERSGQGEAFENISYMVSRAPRPLGKGMVEGRTMSINCMISTRATFHLEISIGRGYVAFPIDNAAYVPFGEVVVQSGLAPNAVSMSVTPDTFHPETGPPSDAGEHVAAIRGGLGLRTVGGECRLGALFCRPCSSPPRSHCAVHIRKRSTPQQRRPFAPAFRAWAAMAGRPGNPAPGPAGLASLGSCSSW